jgi:hypothetical protein
MKHNCQHDDGDGEKTTPFLDAVLDGSIEYDDFYDAYIWFRPRMKPKKWYWPLERHSLCMDILTHCPFCGEKIYEEKP